MLRRSSFLALLAPGLLAAAQPVVQVPPPAPAAPPIVAPPAPPPQPPRVMPSLSDRQADQLRAMLADAEANGMASHATASTSDNTALIQAALDYARALHSGRLASSDFLHDWGLRPQPYDPWTGFLAAVQSDRLADWIGSLPPPYTGYDTLKKGLANYRTIQSKGGWSTLADGPDLAPGATGERVTALRKRLAVEDKTLSSSDAARYDPALVDAVRRAQRRYGLEPTGIANKATLAALNVPVHDRIQQIVANMERWRWLPAELPTHRIQVNIAAAVLTVFEADAPVTSMRAVTGRPDDATPMLSSSVHSVVFNPPWNVPTSIATKELWPKERAHPGYLRSHGYRVIDTGDGGKRLQQRAGAKSALGKVKFDFDNPYGVYLHDTPTQGTFNRYSRLASHGCVRLARPVDLAKLVLKDATDWTPDAIDAALAKGDTVRARLPEPVAVYLLYWTAFGSADGQMSFRGDPYGWDGILATRVEAAANRAASSVAMR
jgi:murein L,D-transpeptidase YcbB/YkuD